MKIANALVLGLGIFLCAGSPLRAEEVIIAAQYPLSGPMASFSGPFLREGTEIAIQRINEDSFARRRPHAQADHRGQCRRPESGDLADEPASPTLRQRARDPRRLWLLSCRCRRRRSRTSLEDPVSRDRRLAGRSPQAGPWSFILIEHPGLLDEDRWREFAAERSSRSKRWRCVLTAPTTRSVRLKDFFAKFLKEHGGTVVSEDGISPAGHEFRVRSPPRSSNEKIDVLYLESVAFGRRQFPRPGAPGRSRSRGP